MEILVEILGKVFDSPCRETPKKNQGKKSRMVGGWFWDSANARGGARRFCFWRPLVGLQAAGRKTSALQTWLPRYFQRKQGRSNTMGCDRLLYIWQMTFIGPSIVRSKLDRLMRTTSDLHSERAPRFASSAASASASGPASSASTAR